MRHFELQFTIHYIQLKNNKGQNKIWEFKSCHILIYYYWYLLQIDELSHKLFHFFININYNSIVSIIFLSYSSTIKNIVNNFFTLHLTQNIKLAM